MAFHVGDKVIHRIYGLGEIVQIEEKELSGVKQRYYVVSIGDLMVWVPVTPATQSSLRLPASRSEFKKLFAILSSPVEPLSLDRFERKAYLQQKMKDGKLESICQVVRDLSFHRSMKKFNDDDTTTLERARNLLLSEWHFTLVVPRVEAEQELRKLLDTAMEAK